MQLQIRKNFSVRTADLPPAAHSHSYTQKECRQNDHYHATYIIFLFHCTITSDFYYRTGIRDASFIIPYFFFFENLNFYFVLLSFSVLLPDELPAK